ncbi:hypothetical protein ACFL2H_06140, partial [Planctomycetota bacterium]
MSNSVQLSLLQLVRALESSSSLLPIERLLIELGTIPRQLDRAENDCDRPSHQQGIDLQLVLTLFDNMLLQLSIEPMATPHRDLIVRIQCDRSGDRLSGPQMEWIPRLLGSLCIHSEAEAEDITASESVSDGIRMRIAEWKQLIASRQVDSDSIVDQLNDGPFRSSALDHAVIDRARDLCMRSIVLQAGQPTSLRTSDSIPSQERLPARSKPPAAMTSHCQMQNSKIQNNPPQEKRPMPGYPNYDLSYDSMRGSRGFFDSPPPISREEIAELRRHVINLNAGRFSGDGDFTTSSADVRGMFREHIPQWADDYSNGGPLRIVLYAHGGLTNEAWGLHTAAKQMKWWKANGVYPIFFVWETGLLETLRQMFGDATRELGLGGTRGWFDDIGAGIADGWDRLRDRTWETTARGLGVGQIWGRMKESAAQTFAVGGDGREVLNELRSLCDSHSTTVKLHAVGHSAGSIFLAHAINTARKRGVPAFKTVHLLAPAITNELFSERFLQGGAIPSNVKRLTVFTMNDALELADTVGPYKKSLLYLIYYALEPERETEVLGLERSLRNGSVTEKLFGLNGRQGDDRAELVFSKTRESSGRSASRSTTHGGFDDDV